MKELLNVKVIVDEAYDVNGGKGNVCMILFHGEASGTYFNGTIMPGGVDTQRYGEEIDTRLSARYMLQGKDDTQKECKLFIENEGVIKKEGDMIFTSPKITTDSESLRWMEFADLIGTVEEGEQCLRIKIHKREG